MQIVECKDNLHLSVGKEGSEKSLLKLYKLTAFETPDRPERILRHGNIM